MPVRFHSPERVVSEIEYLVQNYGVEAIFFADDNLLSNRNRLRKICALIKSRGLDVSWGCNATSNDISRETVELIKDAGCKQLIFGFESGSQRVLDYLGKHTTVEKNSKALDVCKNAGILVRVSFIIGNPTETVEEVRLTQKFIRSNVDKISGYDVYLATPYPGTKLWDWCKEQNLIPDNFEWSDISQETKSVFGTGLACNTIKPKELEALYLETANLKPANFSEMLNESLQHPAKTITRVFRHPLVSCKLLLKGLKIR